MTHAEIIAGVRKALEAVEDRLTRTERTLEQDTQLYDDLTAELDDLLAEGDADREGKEQS